LSLSGYLDLVDDFGTAVTIPGSLAVFQNPVSHARGLIAFIANDHDIGYVYGALKLDYACLPGLTLGLGMTLNKVQAFYYNAILGGQSLTYFSLLAPVLTGYDKNVIIFMDFHSRAPLGPGK
jgi:hypothetical protein